MNRKGISNALISIIMVVVVVVVLIFVIVPNLKEGGNTTQQFGTCNTLCQTTRGNDEGVCLSSCGPGEYLLVGNPANDCEGPTVCCCRNT